MSAKFETLLATLLENAQTEWQLTPVHQGKQNKVYKAIAENQPPVAVKHYAERAGAEREFAVLQGLRDFGINLGAEPLFLSAENSAVIMSWIEGKTLSQPPAVHDETLWHRMMAAIGASGEMPYGAYQKIIPSQGKGYLNPADMMDEIDRKLALLDKNHPLYESLVGLMQRVRTQVMPAWETPVKIGLCRRDPDLHNFIWDGHHLLVLDWEHADWGDMAAEVGLWSAHPAYEDIVSAHWTWLRWEFGRLTHDAHFVPRATLYSRLGQVWWTVHLSVQQPEQVKLRDRYLKRAEKIFPLL